MEHYKNVTGANFMITSTKLYIKVVNFSLNNKINFLETLKPGFK